MNTYLYAPKDDVKHRTLWRALYSETEAAGLEALIRDCHEKRLAFVYSIAPGLDLACSNKQDRANLRRKTSQLLDLNCRRFAILFDDIHPVLSPADSRQFGSVAAAQSSVANELLRFVRTRVADATVFFCPTPYCRKMSGPPGHSGYLKEIGRLLDPSIQIFWTGPEIVSEAITVESIRELRRVIRRKPLLWDNLHANDYDLRRIYLGPYSGRLPELLEEISGVLSNPNCEFEANYVPLRTLAMYARAGGRWNPRRAFQTALSGWRARWKTDPPAGISSADLELFCDCFYLPAEFGPRAQRFLDDFEFLLRTRPKKWGATHRRFERTCARLIALIDKMNALKDRELLFALYRHGWELREEARLLGQYVRWLKMNRDTGEAFVSPDRRPKIYRGGLVAELQRLLPMDEQGRFHDQLPASTRKHDSRSV
jgi:protein O-GlcNAcase/histone acetyltransferase